MKSEILLDYWIQPGRKEVLLSKVQLYRDLPYPKLTTVFTLLPHPLHQPVVAKVASLPSPLLSQQISHPPHHQQSLESRSYCSKRPTSPSPPPWSHTIIFVFQNGKGKQLEESHESERFFFLVAERNALQKWVSTVERSHVRTR